ncbi:hypothetical protein BKA69DRAFT_96972 [Paraphysoderma sedebokerense]|nr:hypothetical protein BKA69DRAFT_96972 [Paraphysoderma sedebokerense]
MMKSLSRPLGPPFFNSTTTLRRNHSPDLSSSIPLNQSLLHHYTEYTKRKRSKSLMRRWFHVNSWSKPSKAVLGLNSVKRDFAIQNPRRLKSSKSGDRLARSPKNEVEENPKSGVLDVINQGKKNGKVMSSTELGTLYENQVIEVLKTFGFKLFRTGGSGDKEPDDNSSVWHWRIR